jgi:hypothetical protein
VILAHIAGMPVEETLLSVGPALVAAVSVGLVHIRSLRDRPAGAGGPSAEGGLSELEGAPVDPRLPAAVGAPAAPSREGEAEEAGS